MKLFAFVLLLAFGGALCDPRALVADELPQPPRTISEPGPIPEVEKHNERVEEQELFLVPLVRDHGEPINRASYRATKVVRTFALDPLSTGYAFILPKAVRSSIQSFARNLRFPSRFVSNLLQRRPRVAGIEGARFLTNSTVGIAGLFDPAARWGLEAPDPEDFGQALGSWGVRPGFFAFLPILGPSSARDTVGMVGDLVLDPASWVPGVGSFLEFNRYSLNFKAINDLEAQEADAYGGLRDLWAVNRERAVRNFSVPTEDFNDRPVASLKAVLLLGAEAPEPQTRRLALPGGTSFSYSYWPGKTRRLVFVLPGLGGFRVTGLVRTLAHRLVDEGYGVVAISSPFHAEFIRHAGEGALPGYTPEDVDRIQAVVEQISNQLHGDDGAEPYAVVGASLGGLHAAFMAARPDTIGFERFVAINPPVDTLYALRQIDDYYSAALEWADDSRRSKIEATLLKAAALANGSFRADLGLPFDEIESRFLIGAAYRHVLRDTIFVTQGLQNLGVLRRTWTDFRREPVYREIAAYSFEEYMRDFVLPFEGDATSRTTVTRTGLRWLESQLRDQSRLRVLTNADDFLLGGNDLDWLRATLGDRLHVFSGGGHLGNLAEPDFLDALVRALQPSATRSGS